VLSADGRAPDPCSGCRGPCGSRRPYGHAAWHSAFTSDNGHQWPGQTWDPRRPNYFDGDPTRNPQLGYGTAGLPAFVDLQGTRDRSGADAIRQSAGPRTNWVFERDRLVHPYR
jgi:hypothetical protein